MKKLGRRIELAVHRTTTTPSEVERYAKYINNPVAFITDILRINLVPLQRRAVESLLEPPYVTLCPSGNEQGKSIVGACSVLWWHCTRSPSIIITTAPVEKQVKDILWKEIRRLATRAKITLKFMPRSCRIERSSDDFAVGMTARDSTSFQGHHGPSMLFVVDEATGVAPEMFEAIEGMFSPPGHALLYLFNPTDTSSRIYQEMTIAQRTKSSHIVRMSALEHPNIEAELKGLPPVVPFAMRLDKFDRLLRKHSQLVGCRLDDKTIPLATDLIWPPVWATEFCEKTKQTPKWWRPGPIAEARLLGRFPRQAVNAVWSDGDWMAATREGLHPLPIILMIPEIGCDVARYGDDYTETHVRCGNKSLAHESVNGQNIVRTANRLKELAGIYAHWHNQAASELPMSKRPESITAQQIPIKVDDDGVGGGVTDLLESDGYNVVPINAGSSALAPKDYPNRRSELWFGVADSARADELDLSGYTIDANGERVVLIDEEVIDELKRQAMALTWTLDARGRRVVCSKDEQKAKLGRSPDGMDAVNLAYAGQRDDNDAMPEVVVSRRNPMGR